MSTIAKPRSATELQSYVQQFMLRAKAAKDQGAPADPDQKGTPAIPVQPDAEDPNKLGLPASGTNPTTDRAPDAATLAVTKPADIVTSPPPAPANGTAQDAAASTKLAASIQATLGNIQTLVSATKQAAAVATPAAPAVASDSGMSEDAVKAANEVFRNIGALLCADTEGRQMVERVLLKSAGEAAAQDMLKSAAEGAQVYALLGQAAAEEQQKLAAEQQVLARYIDTLTPAQQAQAVKLASVQDALISAGDIKDATDLFWFHKGAALAEQALAGAGGDPAAAAEAPVPGADGTPNPEDILQAVIEAVQSGAMPPEEAIQLLTSLGIEVPPELAGGGAGGPPPAEKEASASVDSLISSLIA